MTNEHIKLTVEAIDVTSIEAIEGSPAVIFNTPTSTGQCEWLTETCTGRYTVERTDSHLLSHFEGEEDVYDIIDRLDDWVFDNQRTVKAMLSA